MAGKKTATGAPEPPDEGVVEIPTLRRRTARFLIRGLTPLLSNRITDETMIVISGVKIAKEDLLDEQGVFRQKIHYNDEGVACFPASGVRKAMVTAAHGEEDPKLKYLKQWFTMTEEFLPVLESQPEFRKDPAKNWNARGALCGAVRAQYRRPWSMWVPIIYNAAKIDYKQLAGLLNLTGQAVGIGAWRPERMGIFGQFEVDEVETTKPRGEA